MKRRRISPLMIAGLLALLSALGLIVLVSFNNSLTQIDPTAQQQTVNAIVYQRLTETAVAQMTLELVVTESAK